MYIVFQHTCNTTTVSINNFNNTLNNVGDFFVIQFNSEQLVEYGPVDA